MFRINDIWGGSGPSRCQQKTNFFTQFFLLITFWRVHLHHFSKIKSQKESQNSMNQGFSYFFCMMIEGSGSIPPTSGSRSGRPKNMWIRWIRIRNTELMNNYRRWEGMVLPEEPRKRAAGCAQPVWCAARWKSRRWPCPEWSSRGRDQRTSWKSFPAERSASRWPWGCRNAAPAGVLHTHTAIGFT